MPYCPECSASVPEHADACPTCGASLVRTPTEPPDGGPRKSTDVEREARAAAALSHPNVVRVYAEGATRGA